MDGAVVAEIDRRLAEIVSNENVTIPLAVESGSRAWGFPSPDSDYDCRFIFVRGTANTFTLFPERDVIETPLTPVFDVNGWELSKALKLLLKGNAVILEWLTSPLVYRSNSEFRDAFLSLAGSVGDRTSIGRHYFHLAASQLRHFLDNPERVPLKKLFYSLRPLMALKWLGENPASIVAPMHFQTLCAGVELAPAVNDSISELIARKALTRELGEGAIPDPILAFLRAELERGQAWMSHTPGGSSDARRLVDRFWREWTQHLAP